MTRKVLVESQSSQFKVGDKVKYLGYPGTVSHPNLKDWD